MTIPFAFVGGLLSTRECRVLKKAGSVMGWKSAAIFRGSKVVFDKTVRNARVSRLENPRGETRAIVDKVISTALRVSNTTFNISIERPEVALVILRYGIGGKYKWHIDHGRGIIAGRRISIVVQLSAEKEYTGGKLLFRTQRGIYEAPKLQGTIVVFPSRKTVHALQPVSSGTRYSAVLWLSHPTKRTR
jgi:predicted 2-oxoglutarate/Fe(II)-dependent dioxygenase YbiX